MIILNKLWYKKEKLTKIEKNNIKQTIKKIQFKANKIDKGEVN